MLQPIIIGAGRGSRLNAMTDEQPKCYVPVAGRRIIDWTLDTFREAGLPRPVFIGGYEIGAAAVLLGTDDHPTPTGVFPILSKERHNVSEKYGNAPMPWTLRLTHDGVAIHGGSTVERGWASHGCIGTPDGFVSKLYAIASKGDRVIITDGKRAEVGTPLAAL